MAVQPVNLTTLLAVLNNTGLQQKDPALYQVISQLIKAVRQSISATEGQFNNVIVNPGIAPLLNRSFITKNSEIALLPNSWQLLPGTDISFDDSTPNQLVINSTGGGAEWSVLTNGDIDYPELIFAGGDVIMTHIP
jgi:hypothetical protein